ncbi:MAG TPA: site-specific DNA-methyltransferase [Candidatus Woesebacteria bacterium]|nr:site-specific DNA-methyltransferase [Candidatus Woesebacteria bacterium]
MSTNNKTINKVSEDIKKNRIEKIKNILPEVFEEGKIDLEKLKLALGEEIDERPERFNFTWAGKNKAIKTVLTQSKATLKPAKEESVKFDESENLIIEGDNLEVLKLLQKTYFEKVKMIYIDPPYNTGGDFVYHDDFSAPINSYLKQTGQLDKEGNKQTTNKETNGRYHSDWLSMIYPRLKLAWNLLKDDGIIYISINDIEVHNLRKIMDEIFGEENFISQLVWLNKEGGGGSDSKYFRIKHEYILCYAKFIQLLNIGGVDITNLDRYTLSDEFESERGKFYLQKLGMGSIQYSKSLDYPIISPDKTELFPSTEGKKACWRWSKNKTEWGIKNKHIFFKKDKLGVWQVYTKQYLNVDNNGEKIDRKNRPLATIENFSSTQASKELDLIFGGKVFDYSKPKELVSHLINISSKENNDVILDFFAGSGTTGHSVLEQYLKDSINRKFILVQLPELTYSESEAFKAGYKTIADITKERVRRVIKGYGENPKPINSGFKVFKLAPSNYPEISYEFDPEKTEEENQKSLHEYLAKAKQISLIDKSINPIDIVYENIVKEGFSLNSKVTEGKIDGNNIFIIEDGENEMRICLDKKISPETVKKLSDLEFKSKTFVCYDNALSDSDKANIGLNLELKTI